MRIEKLRKARNYLEQAYTEVELTFFDKKHKEELLKNLVQLQEDISHEICLLDT